MQFKDKLLYWIDIKGTNLNRLSKATGIGYSTLNEIVSGKIKDITTGRAIKLANALNISVSELLDDSERKTPDENIVNNIKLIMGNMTPEEFADIIKDSDITGEKIKIYLSGEVTPGSGTLYVISEVLGIDYNFFYKNNDKESLERAKLDFKRTASINESQNMDSTNEEFLKLYNKIKSNNLDINIVNNMLDLLISQKNKSI